MIRPPPISTRTDTLFPYTNALPIFCYAGIYKEIEAFWNNAYAGSRIVLHGEGGLEYSEYNQDLMHFKNIWLMMYSAVFAGCLGLFYLKRKTNFTAIAAVITNSLDLITFVTAGLLELSALRSIFLGQHLRPEEHTSELQSLMRTSYADFRLQKKKY